jgi:hypothetical protein
MYPFQVLIKGVTPIFKVRNELTPPVMELTLENVPNASHPPSLLVAASSDLDSMNHHESTVVMVSFNIDKVQI